MGGSDRGTRLPSREEAQHCSMHPKGPVSLSAEPQTGVLRQPVLQEYLIVWPKAFDCVLANVVG